MEVLFELRYRRAATLRLAAKNMKKKLTPIAFFEIALALAALAFTVLWAIYPDGPYESWAGIAAVLLLIVDILRRILGPDHEKEVLRALQDLQSLKQELGLADRGQVSHHPKASLEPLLPSEPAPPLEPAPLGSEFIPVLELRGELHDRLRDYAVVRGSAESDQSPRELAKLLPAQDVFGRAVNEFMDVADDLAHAPAPLRDWAKKSGPGLIKAISVLAGEARKTDARITTRKESS